MRQCKPSTLRQPCHGSKRPGFSFIEMILVLVIAGIMASMALPRFSSFLANQHVEAAARRVVVDLALARRQAKITSSNQTVAFTLATNSYLIAGIGDRDRGTVDYEVVLSQSPYRATLVSADFGGDADIVFDGFGVPDSGGTIVVEVGRFQKTIVVDPQTGRASTN